ncbi:lipoprotein [Pseudonocardia hydrocarbonoxydans]|uniref:Putative lipoprotein LprD n=1 Tax=Pseudonocardia hydrocarbonoxydans TaxID=76726 RepID=A0A4Y3WT34_9PSEU|nr:putative lipoprotein LprD [Pseudonocardia hydrocarbonoxydans]
MRLALSPRWMMWHLLTLGAMATCGWLAVWQWQRAGSALGSALNVGYGVQWPVFAVFFGVMWWRLLRMEAQSAVEEPAPAEPAPVPVEAPPADSPFTARPRVAVPELDDAENPRLVAYNQMLRQLAERDPR